MASFPTWKTVGGAAEGAYYYARERGVSEVIVAQIVEGPEAGKLTLEADWLPLDVFVVPRFRIDFAPKPLSI